MKRGLVVQIAVLAIVMVAAGAQAGPYSDLVLGDNPVAYWRLGSVSAGGTETNLGSAGASADGTYTAGAASVAGLLYGDGDTALSVSGTERVSTAGFEKFAGGSGFAVEFWTEFNAVPTGYVNLVGDGQSGGDFDLMVYGGAGGFIRAHVLTAAGLQSIDSVQKFGVGEVHHVVSTWDGTPGNLKLFIDGKQAAVTQYSGSNPTGGSPLNTDNPIYIGKDNRTGASPNAVLDEAAVYDRPLANTEIYGHYLVGTLSGGAVTAPVSYWSFDESATGTGTAYDGTDGNDGTFAGTATRAPGLIGPGAAQINHTTGDGVNVGNGIGKANDFSYTAGLTVEALILPGAGLGSRAFEEIFRKEDGNNRILLSFQNSGTILSFGINDGSGYHELDMLLDGNAGRPTLDDLKDGEAHHIVAAYDSDSGFKGIYIDGALAYSTTVGAGVDMVSGGGAAAIIGNYTSGGEPFSGIIDEVAIYDTALHPSEIAWHYMNAQRGVNYFQIPEPATLALLGAGLALLARRRRKH